jgi:hypothetical protein
MYTYLFIYFYLDVLSSGDYHQAIFTKLRIRFMHRNMSIFYIYIYIHKGKAIPLQALTGPEGSMRLRLPDFKTIGT